MTLPEFRFGTDEACRQHLIQERWPQGFVCPRCNARHSWSLKGRPLIQYAACGHQASVTSGTVFHRSHTPLHKWFLAIHLMTQEKRGISAVLLAQMIDVCYETAWLMLHKLRRAMADRDAGKLLQGAVQVDDAYFGGESRGQGAVGRGTTQTKTLVAISVVTIEREERRITVPAFGRVVVMPDYTQNSCNAAITRIEEAGSTITTDRIGGFGRLNEHGYEHVIKPTAHLPEGVAPFPLVHTFISNAKAWIVGTFHGLPERYKEVYLAECCYRFSRRRSRDELFDRLRFACLNDGPTRLAEIAA